MSSTAVHTVEKVAGEAKHEVDTAADKGFDTVDSNARYLAYFSRLNTAIRAGSRYFAYTSDVGEAFRPVVNPRVVTAAYGISWAYVLGDVSYEVYKSYRKGPTPLEAQSFSEPARLSLMAVKRGSFQAIASMALPALTIHTVVRMCTSAFKDVKNVRLKAWGPTMTGLAVVPFLPIFFDKPVEHVLDRSFDWIEDQIRKEEVASKKEL
ncbi:hypothetical protein DACRYDRAFT_19454 [Dacryopinax primogenitus]|uniref:Mitochondrial fission process protein 1 n=1 Tax=Dacryopinax primogenitus (strain DJM 731) TaxID=1858805 RepID=M5GB62_DACPD|nr:uncharacterized protein DACRYDRAFT_19454 [Dacryopinax primogenitus]EJU06174.1 hypothetical protein DACRYDRAFT_19454 [Dacryopinax primogenitus]